MSIVTDFWKNLFVKKEPFAQAAGTASQAFSTWLGQEGVSQTAVADGLASVKQGISNMLAFADTKAEPILQAANVTVATAAEAMTTALLARAGPIGLAVAGPITAAEDTVIAQGFQVLHAVLDHAEASARAGLSLPAPTNTGAAPSAPSVSNSLPPTPGN